MSICFVTRFYLWKLLSMKIRANHRASKTELGSLSWSTWAWMADISVCTSKFIKNVIQFKVNLRSSSTWCLQLFLGLRAFLSLGKIRMNQICMSKVISDQRLLENAWAKELVHKICIRQIFQDFFETPHELKLHQWNPQEPRTQIHD